MSAKRANHVNHIDVFTERKHCLERFGRKWANCPSKLCDLAASEPGAGQLSCCESYFVWKPWSVARCSW